jgi:branched-chain amino acid aminotransferase
MGGWVYVYGELREVRERHISALDRGFALGDGIFETIRVAGGRAFRLGDHLARLRASARVVQMPVPWTDAVLAEGIAEVLRANGLGEAVVRLTISRGIAVERGLLPSGSVEPTLVIQASSFRELAPEVLARGFSARISSVRRNEFSPASRIKACNYLDNLLARLEAHRSGTDEAIMLNSSGYLACCSTANLHLVSGDRLRTPALECGVLAGVTRQVVRELAAPCGLQWEEAWLRPDDVLSADEAFLTNSVLGIVPLTRVDGVVIGDGLPGPATARLRQGYEGLPHAGG